MHQRILGGIGVVLGGAVLLRRIVAGPLMGQGASQLGRIALVLAVLLLVVGLYYLLRKAPAK